VGVGGWVGGWVALAQACLPIDQSVPRLPCCAPLSPTSCRCGWPLVGPITVYMGAREGLQGSPSAKAGLLGSHFPTSVTFWWPLWRWRCVQCCAVTGAIAAAEEGGGPEAGPGQATSHRPAPQLPPTALSTRLGGPVAPGAPGRAAWWRGRLRWATQALGEDERRLAQLVASDPRCKDLFLAYSSASRIATEEAKGASAACVACTLPPRPPAVGATPVASSGSGGTSGGADGTRTGPRSGWGLGAAEAEGLSGEAHAAWVVCRTTLGTAAMRRLDMEELDREEVRH
jgi:hypothetical protein